MKNMEVILKMLAVEVKRHEREFHEGKRCDVNRYHVAALVCWELDLQLSDLIDEFAVVLKANNGHKGACRNGQSN